MAITWKQIDINCNGYVDGVEETVAKAKGVKNVWNYMTEIDFLTNVTREQKLDLIKKSHFSDDVEVYVGANYQERSANKKKQKENALLKLNNKYEKYVLEHADELAELDNKQMNLFKFLYKSGVLNFKELCNENLNTTFETSKERNELTEHDNAVESYNAIIRSMRIMQLEMNRLLHELEAL